MKLLLLLLALSPFAALASPQTCEGLLTGSRVAAAQLHAHREVHRYELARPKPRHYVTLETTREDETLQFLFIDTQLDAVHFGKTVIEETVQTKFSNAFYRRAWLLAAALRDETSLKKISFAWDSDILSWRDLEDAMRAATPWAKTPPPVEQTWLAKFLARRGFRALPPREVYLPPRDEIPGKAGDFIRFRFELVRQRDWHMITDFVRD